MLWQWVLRWKVLCVLVCRLSIYHTVFSPAPGVLRELITILRVSMDDRSAASCIGARARLLRRELPNKSWESKISTFLNCVFGELPPPIGQRQ
jgi:hypothetical protein